MISPELGEAGFKFSFFITFVSGILCLLTDKGTPEHIISIVTFLIGLLFMGIVIFLVRVRR